MVTTTRRRRTNPLPVKSLVAQVLFLLLFDVTPGLLYLSTSTQYARGFRLRTIGKTRTNYKMPIPNESLFLPEFVATVLGRFLPGIGVYLAGFLTSMLAARLSRQDEYEADEYASALLVKAGIGTGPQKSLFEKLEDLTGTAGAAPAWLMSHPKTAERIAAIHRHRHIISAGVHKRL